MKRLLKKPKNPDPDVFADDFLVIACLIEDSLIQGGAKPVDDYTVVDLYQLAQPFVLSRVQKGDLTH